MKRFAQSEYSSETNKQNNFLNLYKLFCIKKFFYLKYIIFNYKLDEIFPFDIINIIYFLIFKIKQPHKLPLDDIAWYLNIYVINNGELYTDLFENTDEIFNIINYGFGDSYDISFTFTFKFLFFCLTDNNKEIKIRIIKNQKYKNIIKINIGYDNIRPTEYELDEITYIFLLSFSKKIYYQKYNQKKENKYILIDIQI